MNEEQFAIFLRAQQAQQEQFAQITTALTMLLQTLHSPKSSTSSTEVRGEQSKQLQTDKMIIIKHFSMDKFNADSCNVEDFIDFLENKFCILNITDGQMKKEVLLSTLTPDTFRDIKTALMPNFHISSYTDVRKKLQDLFRIKKTRYRALVEFWSCTKEPNESMEHYANRLKSLSRDCGYKDELLERQLRDRFATGLNHQDLETDLKQKWPDLLDDDKEVTFEEIFLIAQSREQAEHDKPITFLKVNKVKNRKRTNLRTKSEQFTQRKLIAAEQCLRCGKTDKHDISKCAARKHICNECNMQGHFESCCIKTGRAYIMSNRKNTFKRLQKISDSETFSNDSQNDESSSEDEDEYVCNVSRPKHKRDCKQIDVVIDGVQCTMDWDPGSTYSIISTEIWRKIGEPTLLKGPKLRAYGNNKLKTKGITDVNVEVNGQQKILPVVVMNNAKPLLFGLNWSEMFNMEFPKSVYSIKEATPTSLKAIIQKHSELFDGKLGKVKNYQVNIHVKPGAEPVHLPARQIKFNMTRNVERELDRLVRAGIITKVDPNVTPLEWATPTVNVLKPNGDVRICGDYSTTLNPVLTKHLHPVPVFDHLRQKLANGTIYSKIDLKDAYLQFEIAPDSKKYLAISTHKGYYQYNRMPFGISTAPSIFQNFLDQLLGDIPNVAVYFDDIALTGKSLNEHLQTLSTVLTRLKTAGLKVNLKKCNFLQKDIEYLGHTIDRNGIRPTKKKIDAITKASEPTNAKELRSFLGVINYYERFIPHLHGLCADLYDLTSGKRRWRWSENERQIFEKAKSSITSAKPLVAYDQNRSLFLACDASEKGVGAVLYHKNKEITQVIAFASRKLKPAERKYSVIDREALAILFGIKKFDQYLRGTKFTLVTDHKPLIHILGPKRNLPKIVNNRLVRWALLIGSYQYDIHYQKGENNILADCLSRLPNPETEPSPAENYVCSMTVKLLENRFTDLHLTEDVLRTETHRDKTLSQVCQCIKTGWRELDYKQEMKHYHRKRFELSIENKVLMWQGRIVIPEILRKTVLKILHQGHPGISAMKALSRFYVWWPSIDEEIENFIKRCTRCQENRPSKSELPVFSWSLPEQVWERVHIDFAGPFEGTYWLVLCDALSKWCELKPIKNITSKNLCLTLDEIFCTFGFPEIIVSDNGPQLTSQEFKDYCKKHGILHITSSPYHPRSNGLAERFVRTFKSRISSSDGSQLKNRLFEFLFTYRNTPHSTTGKSPAQLMFGRQLNCMLSNIRPNKRKSLQYKNVKANIMSSAATPTFKAGDKVYIKTQLEKKWQPATVSAQKHRYSYVVTNGLGKPRRIHADHMRPRLSLVPPSPTIPSTSSPPTAPTHTPSAASTFIPSISSTSTHPAPSPVESTSTSPASSPSTIPSPSSPEFVTPTATAPQLRRSQRQCGPPRRLIDEI